MIHKQLKRNHFSEEGENPTHENSIIGFDETRKKEIIVQYRIDSNRFFAFPYSGSVYPFDRMYKYREIK